MLKNSQEKFKNALRWIIIKKSISAVLRRKLFIATSAIIIKHSQINKLTIPPKETGKKKAKWTKIR